MTNATPARKGRPPLPPGVAGKPTSVHLNDSQRDRFKLLGGSTWLRHYLDSLNAKGVSK